MPDIAVVKEAVQQGVVTEVRRVEGKDMIANCLTKQGASSSMLTKVLQTGCYDLPGGLEARTTDL